MNGWEAFGVYALCILAAAGMLALGYLAMLGAQTVDRERQAGREHMRALAELERNIKGGR